jgi:hypothetical protein
MHRASRYISKYLSKELLMSAPKRCRRVTTSRGIRLLEKSKTEAAWSIIRVPIFRLRDLYAAFITEENLDEEGILESFTTNSICA